jgi:hypothetical protein
MKKWFIIILFVAAASIAGFFCSQEEPISSRASQFNGRSEEVATSLPKATTEQRVQIQSVPAIGSGLSLKERLSKVGFDKTRFPGMAVAQVLEPQDEVDLVKCFHQENLIRDRLAYMVMMTKHGGDNSAVAIMDMVKDQNGRFDGPDVDDNYTALHHGLVLLGKISARSELARQFLIDASDVEYWKLHRQYTVLERFEPHEDRYLAQDALIGLASGGHPEAIQIIQSMKESETTIVAPWAGALCDAVMWFDLSKMEEWPNFLFMSQLDKMRLCSNWKTTDNGKKWSTWSKQVQGIQ